MIVITRFATEYNIADTESRKGGWYSEEGTFLRGEKVLSESEAAFRIWNAKQSPVPEMRARRLWEAS
jgi:hypothetical protein